MSSSFTSRCRSWHTAWNVYKTKAKIYTLRDRGKALKWSFTLGITFQVLCQQHTHAAWKGLSRSMVLQEDRLSPCSETPPSIGADIQSVKLLSQHYYKTSNQEGAETVTSYRHLCFHSIRRRCTTAHLPCNFPGFHGFRGPGIIDSAEPQPFMKQLCSDSHSGRLTSTGVVRQS